MKGGEKAGGKGVLPKIESDDDTLVSESELIENTNIQTGIS